MIETWVLRLLVLASLALFTAQMATRVRLFARAKNNIRLTGLAGRLRRVLLEVICQTKVIAEKPPVGVGHAMVFWGFVAFAGYTGVQFLKGLGIADFTGQRWFHLYSLSVVPFALAVLIGM